MEWGRADQCDREGEGAGNRGIKGSWDRGGGGRGDRGISDGGPTWAATRRTAVATRRTSDT